MTNYPRSRFMLSLRKVCLLTGLAGVALGALLYAPAHEPADPEPAKKPKNQVIQEFPSNDRPETAWKVHWATAIGYGLYIQDAWFKKSPDDEWMQVLGDARCSELFVPYHRG